jgi:hypothetical protein
MTYPTHPKARNGPMHFASLQGRRLFRIFFLLVSLCLIWTVAPGAFAQSPLDGASEERVKAAYLYKLPNYVEWPSHSFAMNDSPYVIGVVEAGTVANELIKISNGRRINNRSVVVRKLRSGEAPEGVHLLFVGRAERAGFAQLAKSVQSQPILIVTETDGALGQGSTINFLKVDDRIRIEVSLDTAEKSGLKLSSRLLAIAVNVLKDSQR